MATTHRYKTKLSGGDCCYKTCVGGSDEHFKANFGSVLVVGSIKLYNETGQNTDGAMTQKATTDALAEKVNAIDLANIAYTGDVEDLIQNGKIILYCGSATEVIA